MKLNRYTYLLVICTCLWISCSVAESTKSDQEGGRTNPVQTPTISQPTTIPTTAAEAALIAEFHSKPEIRMAAFGDSISRAFAATEPREESTSLMLSNETSSFSDRAKGRIGRILEKPSFSWSTGDNTEQYWSHYKLMVKAFGPKVTATNYALTGAESNDLARQVSNSSRHHIDYATMLVGANDICVWETEDLSVLPAFDRRVTNAVATLVQRNPNIKILMGTVPNIVNLYELGKAHSCERRWQVHKFCDGLLLNAKNEQDIDFYRRHVKSVNEHLVSIASRFPNNVRISRQAEYSKFSWDEVSSIDCFHPSKIGQNHLAVATWLEGWFSSIRP